MKKLFNKIFFSGLVAIFMLFIISCSKDFLDQKPTSSITEATYYRNVRELESGLVACFGHLKSVFDVDHWSIGDVGSDDADKGSTDIDQAPLLEISFSRQLATNYWVYDFWMHCYGIIARCNEVIDKSAGTERKTQEDIKKIEEIADQARFLRALCYYHLVTQFGDVPLVDRFLSPNDVDLMRSPSADIWAFIESDLLEASNLPDVSGWNESGRVTSGAVYSLLGKVYLTQKKYTQANSAFYKVVASEKYKLVNDFGFIFRHDGENCEESIFEIQYKARTTPSSLGSWSGPFRMPRDPGPGWGFDCPTTDLFNEFEQGDPRIIYTFLFRGDVFPIDENSTYTAENTLSPSGYQSRKAWIPFEEREGLDWLFYDINYRYMRYAEVLLLYAESLNEINKPDSAVMLVNLIRTRARETPVTDPQRISCAYTLSHTGPLLPDITYTGQAALREAIWHEQRVELANEGHRRNSLLRTGRFKICMEKAKSSRGCTVEPHEWLLPIPFQEIELSNRLLTQNPGY